MDPETGGWKTVSTRTFLLGSRFDRLFLGIDDGQLSGYCEEAANECNERSVDSCTALSSAFYAVFSNGNTPNLALRG